MVVQTAAADAADASKKNYLRSAHANAVVKKANEVSNVAAATVAAARAAARDAAAADAVTIAALRQQVIAVKFYIFFKFGF